MLGLSLAVGVVQINVSLAMKGYLLVKRDKDVIGLFNEVISWFSILIGIILLALNMLLKLADGFKIAGIVFMVVGVLLILVLGGRGKKGIKKIFGGFSQLYGGVNFFSDILSYSRLFGLGLSTAVIGMVVNEICKVIINILTFNGISVLGVIVAIPILRSGTSLISQSTRLALISTTQDFNLLNSSEDFRGRRTRFQTPRLKYKIQLYRKVGGYFLCH